MCVGCNSNRVFEGNLSIKGQEWYYEDELKFETPIEDTTQLYNLFINVRHTNDFPYSNLWLKIHTTFPDGTKKSDPLNLPMAEESGRWFGTGVGSVLSNQVMIQKNATLNQTGVYKFGIEQNMRINPLKEVLDIGLLVEKSENTLEHLQQGKSTQSKKKPSN